MNSADRTNEKLDAYLKSSEKKLKKKKKKWPAGRKEKSNSAISNLKRWTASAAMDLYRISIVLTLLLMSAGFCAMMDLSLWFYFLYGAIAVIFCALIYGLIDFYHYKTWHSRLNFKLDGWKQATNSRTANFWKADGEYWVATQIKVILSSSASEKHLLVTEAFLKKLRRRLNQWTVSEETHVGYSQPDGWRIIDLTLSGDMNARVMNVIRKRFSKEFNKLSLLMNASIDHVSITCHGPEKYHEVYSDTD